MSPIFQFQSLAEKSAAVLRRIRGMRRRISFRESLIAVLDTPDGRVVFEQFLRDCHVTTPLFSRDPMETAANEGRCHLAMSYLNILKQDNLHELLSRLEAERDETRNNNAYDHE